MVEREGGLLQLFHRQLWCAGVNHTTLMYMMLTCSLFVYREATECRYADEKVRLHRNMGKYFGGLIPGADLERIDVGKMGLQRQPLLLSGELFEQRNLVVNRRRCQEAPTHLLECLGTSTGPSSEQDFVASVCDVDFVGACVRAGEVYKLVQVLAEASKRCAHSTPIYHYFRCLLKDATTINDSPNRFLHVASFQPKCSVVLRDLEQRSCYSKYSVPSSFGADDVVRVRTYGAPSDFGV